MLTTRAPVCKWPAACFRGLGRRGQGGSSGRETHTSSPPHHYLHTAFIQVLSLLHDNYRWRLPVRPVLEPAQARERPSDTPSIRYVPFVKEHCLQTVVIPCPNTIYTVFHLPLWDSSIGDSKKCRCQESNQHHQCVRQKAERGRVWDTQNLATAAQDVRSVVSKYE